MSNASGHPPARAIVVLSAIQGGLYSLVGTLSMIAGIVTILAARLEDSNIPVWASFAGSAFTAALGLPGLLTFFFRKRPQGNAFALVTGIILTLHAVLIPLTLPGPPPLTLFVFGVAGGGIWILLSLYGANVVRPPSA